MNNQILDAIYKKIEDVLSICFLKLEDKKNIPYQPPDPKMHERQYLSSSTIKKQNKDSLVCEMKRFKTATINIYFSTISVELTRNS